MEVVSDIHRNHSDMAKFASLEDPGFISICRGLERFFSDLQGTRESRKLRKCLFCLSLIFHHLVSRRFNTMD